MILRDKATGDYAGIICEFCETEAPPASEILKGFGLNNMGWYCSGGKHYCPEHAEMGKPR